MPHLQILAKNDIISAPLVMMPSIEDLDGDEGMSMSPSLIGWTDIGTILRGFLSHLEHEGKDIKNHKMLELMTVLENCGQEYSNKLLVTLQGEDDAGLVYQADAGATSVASVIKNSFLPIDRNGINRVVHRIALFESHGEVTAVISQMDVVTWLNANVDQFAEVADKTIDELGLCTGKIPVVSASAHQPALSAYAEISKNQVSGAPVLTEAGILLANLSISDLRALQAEHFGSLALPTAEFLALLHKTAYLGYSASASAHGSLPFFASSRRNGGPVKGDINTFTVSRSTTLRQVLKQLVEQHVHRLYVCTEDMHVESVLSLTDLLRFFGGVF